MGDSDVLGVGLNMLEWLLENQTEGGSWFSPIGCHGFWKRGGEKAKFDQQPLEAWAMVSACLQAAEATSDTSWAERAAVCAAWFTGYNDLGLDLYDRVSGGCHDALRAAHWNENQGAESTIACQMAIVEMMLAKQKAKRKEELCMA